MIDRHLGTIMNKDAAKVDDLVERLFVPGMLPGEVGHLRNEAAAEIKSLRAQLAAAEARASEYCEMVKSELAQRLVGEAQLETAKKALGEIANTFDDGWHKGSVEFRMGDKAREALRSLNPDGDNNG